MPQQGGEDDEPVVEPEPDPNHETPWLPPTEPDADPVRRNPRASTSGVTNSSSDEIEELVADIQRFVSGGHTVEKACARLARLGVQQELLDYARAGFEQAIGVISSGKKPTTIVSPHGVRKWYAGPRPDDLYWGEFKKQVAASLPEESLEDALRDIDQATSRILNLAGAPGDQTIRSKGLVLGYVQSGKTTNFMGVMAKAADQGYRLFIVLSGITDNLRSQTQDRVHEVLLGDTPGRWHMLTQPDADFATTGNAVNLLSDPHQRMIAVVKKNAPRLRRLKDWINSAGSEVARTVPIMVIDDESDQASLNVATGARVSRINSLIGQILEKQRSAYVAYTATPFANLLTEPTRFENLYPDDYIVEMPRPDGYFGAERLFGRDALGDETDGVDPGLDIIRVIPPLEAGVAKPPTGKGAVDGWYPPLTPALQAAVDWYLIATAARRARDGEPRDSTMLVHTSMLAKAHERLREPIRDYLDSLRDTYPTDPSIAARFAALWASESEAVPAASVGLNDVTWQAVHAQLPEVLTAARTVIDNYRSTDRLAYKKGDPQTVIVIGGNTLSRGLTLEGLISSYFVRSASAYDTLLQMGRWFGYRRGYEDLPRVWMPADLAEWFQDLATVEEEIRREIRAYGPDVTPQMVAVRIREHPAMAITSAAKMRGAVRAAVNYGGKREQTILFDHKNKDWLASNRKATEELLRDAIEHVGLSPDSRNRILVRGVPGSRLLRFLEDYRMHPNAFRLRSDLLTGYIKQEMAVDALQSWNIVVIENPARPVAQGLHLGTGRDLRPLERSRLERYTDYANIKILASVRDRIADIDLATNPLPSDVDPTNDKQLAKFRQDTVGDTGLLCIYPIDKNSKPGASRSAEPRDPRTSLDAAEHMIGLTFFFPYSVGASPYSYLSADISQPVEDEEDFGAIEDADEALAEAQTAHDPGAG